MGMGMGMGLRRIMRQAERDSRGPQQRIYFSQGDGCRSSEGRSHSIPSRRKRCGSAHSKHERGDNYLDTHRIEHSFTCPASASVHAVPGTALVSPWPESSHLDTDCCCPRCILDPRAEEGYQSNSALDVRSFSWLGLVVGGFDHGALSVCFIH